MRLIKVEAHGFKSFADKTVLEFDGGIVGIVGPNGSGKSNINDAIKWVLGEQSSKSLRGDSMEDIIFSGSKTVPAMKRAEVSLTFDNSEGRTSIPHNKIVITRRITRGGGGNEYFINGETARLKDIKEIAMESGIGKSSLAIISQGTISDIAQATPEERRAFFEEAAGISKYKHRKVAALRKLEKTTETLEKIQSIVRELEKQLNPLRKQAEKAKQYLALTKELKDVEVGLIVEDVAFFKEQLESLSDKYQNVIETKEELTSKIKESELTVKQKSKIKLQLENETLKMNEDLQKISEQINELSMKSAAAEQRRQLLIDGGIAASDEVKTIAMKEQLEELSIKLFEYKEFINKSEEDVRTKKQATSSVEMELSQLGSKQQELKTKLYKVKTKIDILNDHKKNKNNLFKGTKTIVQNQSAFSGFKGIVADLIDVESNLSKAIETILQNALQHIVVDNSNTAIECVEFLKRNRGGRATFIPLQVIKPKTMREDHKLVLNTQSGVVGIASTLVKTKPEYEILKKFLLGNVIVAETIQEAKQISNILDRRYMVVSLDGNVIKVGGVVSGGEAAVSKDLLGVDKQIEKLNSFIPVLEKELHIVSDKHNTISESLSDDRTYIGELYIEIAKTKEKLINVEEQYHFLKDKYESATKKTFLAKTEKPKTVSKDALKLQESTLKTQINSKREKLFRINNELNEATSVKTEYEATLRKILEDSSEMTTQKNQAEFYVTSSMRRLSEEYQMTIEMATESFSLSMDREVAREIVSTKRKEISELGHVNVDAIEDFEKVNERHEKLSTSEQEIFNAQQSILQAIDKMDKIIITKLDETVSDTRTEFQKVFETMFGGGVAKIKYTDPENLLETGIEIIAQPPGKAVRNLKLFSGGEKAIIAISLLFAILKSKPLPLCILDEVEAALDEANVLRYAHFLQTLKDKTQFILVTHRIGTMENVDHLFGATMQHRGVTSFVTVKLDVAKTMIEN